MEAWCKIRVDHRNFKFKAGFDWHRHGSMMATAPQIHMVIQSNSESHRERFMTNALTFHLCVTVSEVRVAILKYLCHVYHYLITIICFDQLRGVGIDGEVGESRFKPVRS
jgi:hypothetical protein